jgi:hypothetical protein
MLMMLSVLIPVRKNYENGLTWEGESLKEMANERAGKCLQ